MCVCVCVCVCVRERESETSFGLEGIIEKNWRQRRVKNQVSTHVSKLKVCVMSVQRRTRATEEKANKVRESIWRAHGCGTSAQLTCYPDRLKTLKLGGSIRASKAEGGKGGRRGGGLKEGDRVTKSRERGSLHEEKREGKEGEERKSRGYMWLFEVVVELWSETE